MAGGARPDTHFHQQISTFIIMFEHYYKYCIKIKKNSINCLTNKSKANTIIVM